MRIDPKQTTVTPVAAKVTREPAAPRSEREAPAAVVKLSSAGTAAVDTRDAEAKVARIRNAIDTGTYKVDLDVLAARIVEDGPFGGDAW